MAVLVKPGDAWETPEDIQTPGAGGVMESAEAVREPQADGTWVDVWPEYQQAVHYLMLYDGSLGQAGTSGANICKDVTGGWSRGYSANTSDYREDFTNSYMRVYTSALAAGYVQGIFTNQKIDFTRYNMLIISHEPYRTTIASDYGYAALSNTVVAIADDRNKNYMSSNSSAVARKNIGGLKQQRKIVSSINIYSVSAFYYVGVMDNYGQGGDKIFELFAVEPDDWQTWLSKAGLSAASLAAVMADSAALTTLLSSYAATQYMLLQCTGDVMASAIQSAAFKAALAASPYKDKVYANPHWSKFLRMV